MEYINKILNKQEYKLDFKSELFEITIYTVVCFFLPFLAGHPQLFVGTMVNAMLITSALNIRGTKLLPVIIAPSLGVLSRGLLFGPFTIFLLYMAPFIWIGNSILVFAFKWLNLDKKLNKGMTLLLGSIAKAGFLFGIAYLLVNLEIIPTPFLTAMGLTQLYTALLGGFVAFGLHAAKKKLTV